MNRSGTDRRGRNKKKGEAGWESESLVGRGKKEEGLRDLPGKYYINN